MVGRIRLTLVCGMAIIGDSNSSLFSGAHSLFSCNHRLLLDGDRVVSTQSFNIVPHKPRDRPPTSAESWQSLADSSSVAVDDDSSMWPYPTYRPISWDRYYTSDIHDKHISLTSGLAAGITIGVFFAVFILTFGCRLYSQRSESLRRLSSRSTANNRNFSQRRLSVSDFLQCSSIRPPPPYELSVAIRMPSDQGEPPPFTPTPVSLDSQTCEEGHARPA